MIRISPNTYFAQSKGDWLFFQIGFTAVHFRKIWGNKDSKNCLRIMLFAPWHDPKIGYTRGKFGVSFVNNIIEFHKSISFAKGGLVPKEDK